MTDTDRPLTEASQDFGHDIENAWRYDKHPPANLDSRLATIEAAAVERAKPEIEKAAREEGRDQQAQDDAKVMREVYAPMERAIGRREAEATIAVLRDYLAGWHALFPTPDPARYLDLDSPDAATALGRELHLLYHGDTNPDSTGCRLGHKMDAKRLLAALRNPTADEGE